MSMRQRLSEWWRGRAEDRKAVAQAEDEPVSAGEDSDEKRADDEQDVIDLGTGGGAT
jgi:hypothetical protein